MQISKNDYGYYLNFTIQDSSGAAFLLTGYTITLKVWVSGKPDILILTGDCPIVVAALGTCHYSVANGDFAQVGKYTAELELTQVGVIESTSTFIIEVMESG